MLKWNLFSFQRLLKTSALALLCLVLCACDMTSSQREKLAGTWACDGVKHTRAGDVFFYDRRYARYDANHKVIYEGSYTIKGRVLTTRVKPLAWAKNPVSRTGAERFNRQYRMSKLTRHMIELERLDANNVPQGTRTCRKIQEAKPGAYYLALRPKQTKPGKAKLAESKTLKQSIEESAAKSAKPTAPGQGAPLAGNQDKVSRSHGKVQASGDKTGDKADSANDATSKSVKVDPAKAGTSKTAARKASESDQDTARQKTDPKQPTGESGGPANPTKSKPDEKPKLQDKKAQQPSDSKQTKAEDETKQESSDTKTQTASLLDTLRLQRQAKLQRLKAMDPMFREQGAAYSVLKSVSQALPKDAQLLSIHSDKGVFRVRGTAANEESMQRYLRNLQNTHSLYSVKLAQQSDKDSRVMFTIQLNSSPSGSAYQYIRLVEMDKLKDSPWYHRKQIERLDLLRNRILARLPNKRKTSRFLQAISSLAGHTGLQMKRFNLIKEIRGELHRELIVDISVRGSYDSFLLFMGRLAGESHPLHARSLRIKPRARDNVRASFKLHVYRAQGTTPRRTRGKLKSSSFVYFTPYNKSRLHDPNFSWNPFQRRPDRISASCSGPLSKKQLSRVRLVAITEPDLQTAYLKTRKGNIYTVKAGSCIGRNVKILRIKKRAITLRIHRASASGKPRNIDRNLSLVSTSP